MGAGKPIIYSDLKGIREHMGTLSFGRLVNPQDAEEVSELIINYAENPELYRTHALNARKEFKEKYNWGTIRNSFVDFVKRSVER
jgi:glycosyltransferase involved in cell wall biosynthesis